MEPIVSTRKRARVEQDDEVSSSTDNTQLQKNTLSMTSTKGTRPRGVTMGGSAWDGQMESLATDAFLHHDFTNMQTDIYHNIKTSAHIMGVGGNICNQWKRVPSPVQFGQSTLGLSMGYVTGNVLMGQANMFNQYQLCKLKRFTITFKDIVVALETSTSLGLQTMSDVITEWRRRPAWSQYGGGDSHVVRPPAENDYPEWWGDWRPATDGAVSFSFEVDSKWVPVHVTNTRIQTNTGWRDASYYRSLGQWNFGKNIQELWEVGSPGSILNDGDIGPSSGDSRHWLDWFFEWRARNCPNSTSGTNTSAVCNIQIDSHWEMAHRMTDVSAAVFPSN